MAPPTDDIVMKLGGVSEVEGMPGVRLVVVNGLGSVPAWRLGGGCYGYIELVDDTPEVLLDLRGRVLDRLRFQVATAGESCDAR